MICDNYLIASGMGSIPLCKLLGIRLPMIGFKGHSLDVYLKSPKDYLKETHILIPDQVAIVKMGVEKPYVRFTAYADIDGNNI